MDFHITALQEFTQAELDHVVPIKRGFVSSFEFAVATKKGKENQLNLITIGNV